MVDEHEWEDDFDGEANPHYKRFKKASVVILVGMTALSLMGTPAHASHGKPLPRCYEDETLLVGKGDFSHGRYARYECVHPENLTAVSRDYPDVGAGIAEAICEHQRFWARMFGIGPIVEEACNH